MTGARPVPRAGARLLRLAYVAVIAAATLSGLAASPDLAAAAWRLTRALHPVLRTSDVVDGVRNVALFAGFGAVWLGTSPAARLRQALVRATLAGALVSAAAEGAQLFSPRRMASVLDLATNTAGALLGALGVALAVAAARARPRRPLAPVPLALVAVPYALACACEAFSPLFRNDRVPGAWGGPGVRWAAALADLQARGPAPARWSDVLLFAPAGALAVLLWCERGGGTWGGAAAGAVALGGAVAVAELLRGAVGGDLSPASVGLRAAAVLAGGVITAALAGTRPRARLAAAVARYAPPLYTAALLVWAWRPFRPVGSLAAVPPRLGGDALVPLAALAQLYNLHGVIDVAVGFFLYAPVGAWIAASRAARVRDLWPGFALALAAELGQLFVAARTFDVTDVLVQGAGVFLGWAVVRQAATLRAARDGAPHSPLGNVSATSASCAAASHARPSSSGTTADDSSTWYRQSNCRPTRARK